MSGFRVTQLSRASKIQPGDRFICYVAKVSRFAGVTEIARGPYQSKSPLFSTDGWEVFTVRFDVIPIVMLPLEDALPIKDPELWARLDRTKNLSVRSRWAHKAHVASSLVSVSDSDGFLLEHLLHAAQSTS